MCRSDILQLYTCGHVLIWNSKYFKAGCLVCHIVTHTNPNHRYTKLEQGFRLSVESLPLDTQLYRYAGCPPTNRLHSVRTEPDWGFKYRLIFDFYRCVKFIKLILYTIRDLSQKVILHFCPGEIVYMTYLALSPFWQSGPKYNLNFRLFVLDYGLVVLIVTATIDPVNIQKRTTIGPPEKRHLNGVSLAGRWWPDT